MNYLSNIKKELDRLKVNYTGCNQSEINEIKNHFNTELPKCYIEFLERFGRGMSRDNTAGRGFLQGSAAFYPSVLDLTSSLRNDLKESANLKLPESSFVFYDSQGILNAFFRFDDGDNPKIYGYEEGFTGDTFPLIAESLSSFYERLLFNDKELFKELRE